MLYLACEHFLVDISSKLFLLTSLLALTILRILKFQIQKLAALKFTQRNGQIKNFFLQLISVAFNKQINSTCVTTDN